MVLTNAHTLAHTLFVLLAAGAKAKVLFRRSKAFDEMGKVEDAFEDITGAKETLDNKGLVKDKAVEAHYGVVHKKYRELKKREHEAAKTLWKGKLGGEPNATTSSWSSGEKEEVVEEEDGKQGGALEDVVLGEEKEGEGWAAFLSFGFLWKFIRGLFRF